MDKKILDAVWDVLMGQVDSNNYGMMGTYKVKFSNVALLRKENISVSLDRAVVEKNGQAVYKIQRKYAAKKVNGMYSELKPKLIAVA